jgi:hypothetical protein
MYIKNRSSWKQIIVAGCAVLSATVGYSQDALSASLPQTNLTRKIEIIHTGKSGVMPPVGNKKLINIGWYSPSPQDVRADIRTMEQRPFDGVVMVLSNRFERSEIFVKRLQESDLAKDYADLSAIEWKGMKDNFLRIGMTGSERDWFSDSDWEISATNLAILCKAARLGHCNILIDPEHYHNGWLWSYEKLENPSKKSFLEYEVIVRKRGQQFMQVMQEQIPDVKILMVQCLSRFRPVLESYAAGDVSTRVKILSANKFGLLPAFINGMLDVAGPNVEIHDGNENLSYYVEHPTEYIQNYQYMNMLDCLIASENHAKFKKQYRASMAVYLDYCYNLGIEALSGRVPISEFMTPEERARYLEHNVYWALSSADTYAWVYDEHVNWWTSVMPKGMTELIPQAVVDAVTSGRNLYNTNTAQKPDIRSIFQRIEDDRVKRCESLIAAGEKIFFDDFEQDSPGSAPKKWTTYSGNEAKTPAEFSVSDKNGYQSTRSAMVSKAQARFHGLVNTYDVKPGEQYVVEAYCRNIGFGEPKLVVMWKDAEGKPIQNEAAYSRFATATSENGWHKAMLSVTVPTGEIVKGPKSGTVGKMTIVLYAINQDSETDVTFFDNVSIYKIKAGN